MRILYFLFAVIGFVLSREENFPTGRQKSKLIIPEVYDVTSLSQLRDAELDKQCFDDIKRVVVSLQNESWALEIVDSMEIKPYGFLHGRTAFLGSFDECIYADAGSFTGKYCLAQLGNPNEMINPPTDFSGFRISYGICMPSSCTADNVQTAINSLIPKDLNLSVQVARTNCFTREPDDISAEAWWSIGFFCIITAVVVASTIFDALHHMKLIETERHELYSSFSLYTNCQQMVRVNTTSSNIGCLHGIRSLTMCWVILCHEYTMGVFAPVMNAKYIMQGFMPSRYKIPITNGFVAVDTFFFLSGLLATLVFFRNISKTGSFDYPVAVIHRYIRLTPALGAMVLIQAMIIPLLGRGPYWGKVIDAASDTCKNSWWSGLLYIQNLVNPTSSCLGQSWYLSSDTQMFWLSPIILYPLLLWRMKGVIFMFFALAMAVTTNFVVSFIYELGPSLFNTSSDKQFEVDYVQTYMRITPYIVGMALGYLICGMKAKKITINLSRKWIIIGWLSSTAICLGTMYSLIYFIDNNDVYKENHALSSSYLALHRLTWSLGIAWVIFACIAGYGGPVDYILSWWGFQIIGKISYCMFLVHFTVQLVRSGLMQSSFYIHDFLLVSNFLSTFVFSILFAIPLYLFFEAPFSNLDRYFLRKVKIFPYPRKEEEKTGA